LFGRFEKAEVRINIKLPTVPEFVNVKIEVV